MSSKMYSLSVLGFYIAALICIVPAAAGTASYFELTNISTHSPSGRSQPANNELYLDIIDPVTGANSTCSIEWDYKEPPPSTWVPCSDPTFSIEYDYYNSLQDFQIEVQHVYGGEYESDQCSSLDQGGCIVRKATATFGRDDPKWRLNCGGSGVCNAYYANGYCALIEED